MAIIGGGIAAYLYKQRHDEEDRDFQTGLVIVLAGSSLVLGAVSIAGNIYFEDGPFHTAIASEATTTDVTDDNMQAKMNVSPEQCTRLQTQPQTRQMVKAMCNRMYPSNSWGDSAARAVCESEEKEKMDACGVEFMPSY